MGNKHSLDENIKSYYQSQPLSEDTLARMKTMAEQGLNTRKTWLSGIKIFQVGKLAGLAASAIFILVVSVQMIGEVTSAQLADRVVKEVALNHQKNLKIEFEAKDYAKLNKVMNKLDFIIQMPEKFKDKGYVLLGSRYCSIQGHIAAQIKLKDKSEQVITLYITALNDDLLELPEKVQAYKGLSVATWHEDNLFYSLASNQ